MELIRRIALRAVVLTGCFMERLLSAVRALLSRRHWPLAGVIVAVAIGAVLRLVWVGDMEWKADERWTYEQAQKVHSWSDLPRTGMPASVGIPNPALSVWVFVGLSKLFAVTDPTGLARAVQICNIAALVLLVWFAYRFVLEAEREPWLWAAALVAVNPIAVLLQRKIWPPSVLPLLTVFMLCAWHRRERRIGGFLWGFVAVCSGQVHMGGFFFAAGFALWALLFDRRRVAWGAWLCGSCLGALPMLPWLWMMATAPVHNSITHDNWQHALELKFWTRWVLESFGFGVDYTLQSQFNDFLSYPYVFGRPTYLVACLHGVLAVMAFALLFRLVRSLWERRKQIGQRFVGKDSPSGFTQNAALWGFGSLLTASCCSLHRHYMVILFPLEFLWLARLALMARNGTPGVARWGRASLVVLWTTQLLISMQFLDYIHIKQRIAGEYGATYAAQQSALQSSVLEPGRR